MKSLCKHSPNVATYISKTVFGLYVKNSIERVFKVKQDQTFCI